MRKLVPLLLFPALLACIASTARNETENLRRANEAFDAMKSLAGRWTATIEVDGEPSPVVFDYRVTAAGNALVEHMFPGTEHEMVTLYHLDGSDLRLTHYCAAGNQPSMLLAGASSPGSPERILTFEFDRATNMASPQAGHMHRASYSILGPDHVIATWAYFTDGTLDHETHFDLMREPTVETAAAAVHLAR